MSLRTLLRQFQTFGDLILFTSCSYILSRHIAWMANARRKAIQEKRRQGIRPYCRKRTLAPRPIAQSAQGFGLHSAELNSKNEKNFSAHTEQLSKRHGAPPGNRNALRNGKHTREHRALYAAIRAHIREGQALIAWCRLLPVPKRVRRIVEHVLVAGETMSSAGISVFRRLRPK
jgi:hypothetical protein